jgi:hypothetical protein
VLKRRTRARAHALVGWLSGRLDLSARPCGRARGVAGVGVVYHSGYTGHFLLVNAPCLNKVKSQTPFTVRLPNGATMESSHTAALNIPELSAAASIAHVIPGMTKHSLISVGQLCNEGYIVNFRNASVTIPKNLKFQATLGTWTLASGASI